MKPIAVIQARMGSSRLPGKVLAKIGGLPAISHTYRRAASALPTYVAIPNTKADRPLIAYCRDAHIPFYLFNGDQNDVLARYAAVTTYHKPSHVVRLTADCPWIDPALLQKCVAECDGMQYVSNVHPVRTWPHGLDVEVIHAELILRAHDEATDPADREHVTPWVKRHARLVHNVRQPVTESHHRWVLDTAQDLAWFRDVALALDVTPPHPTRRELLDFIQARPDYGHYEDPIDSPARA